MKKILRYSRQRERIYEYMCGISTHPSAEMIYRDLQGEFPELSLATVYRNIRVLEERGQLRRVAVHRGVERYDTNCSDHVHFLCDSCDAVIDIKCSALDEMVAQVQQEIGYTVQKADLILTGRCSRCV